MRASALKSTRSHACRVFYRIYLPGNSQQLRAAAFSDISERIRHTAFRDNAACHGQFRRTAAYRPQEREARRQDRLPRRGHRRAHADVHRIRAHGHAPCRDEQPFRRASDCRDRVFRRRRRGGSHAQSACRELSHAQQSRHDEPVAFLLLIDIRIGDRAVHARVFAGGDRVLGHYGVHMGGNTVSQRGTFRARAHPRRKDGKDAFAHFASLPQRHVLGVACHDVLRRGGRTRRRAMGVRVRGERTRSQQNGGRSCRSVPVCGRNGRGESGVHSPRQTLPHVVADRRVRRGGYSGISFGDACAQCRRFACRGGALRRFVRADVAGDVQRGGKEHSDGGNGDVRLCSRSPATWGVRQARRLSVWCPTLSATISKPAYSSQSSSPCVCSRRA